MPYGCWGTSGPPERFSIQAKVVEADERESGERKSLNVGHTTGHAVELSSGLSHGECVLWGMLFETMLAKEYGVADAAYAEELCRLVRRALGTAPLSRPDFSRIGEAAEKARSDKKNADDGKICMSVGVREGEWALFALPFAEYRAGLQRLAAEFAENSEISEKEGGRI